MYHKFLQKTSWRIVISIGSKGLYNLVAYINGNPRVCPRNKKTLIKALLTTIIIP